MFGPSSLVIFLIGMYGIFAEASNLNAECKSNWNVEQLLSKIENGERIKLAEGVKFVKVNGSFEREESRSGKLSVLSRVKRFLNNYRLELKLSNVFKGKTDIENGLRRALTMLNRIGDDTTSRATGTPFAGGKKGGGPIMMMATMLGGTLAALGFGGLSMFVMKALTVSAMAFVLSAILGLRWLFSPDFGRLSYVPVHPEHIRKRRSLQELPYRAYLSGT